MGPRKVWAQSCYKGFISFFRNGGPYQGTVGSTLDIKDGHMIPSLDYCLVSVFIRLLQDMISVCVW